MEKEKKPIKENLRNKVDAFKEKADDAINTAKDGGDKLKNEIAIKANDAIADVQVGGKKVAEKYADTMDAINRKIYSPITKEEFLSSDFEIPNMIRLLDKNIHANKDVCKDAVAFRHIVARNNVLEIIKKECPSSKLKFYPNLNDAFYYRNPYVDNFYISLDEYFDFIKKERVNELINVASCLGAKRVRIVFKEEKKHFVSAEGKKGDKLKGKKALAKVDASNEIANTVKASTKDLQELDVASEMTFDGTSEIERPKLVYFKNDSDIESLINMVMKGKNPPKSKTYTLAYNRSSDINLETAIKIDTVLDKLGMTSTASVKSEVENEKRLFMEYHIEF